MKTSSSSLSSNIPQIGESVPSTESMDGGGGGRVDSVGGKYRFSDDGEGGESTSGGEDGVYVL